MEIITDVTFVSDYTEGKYLRKKKSKIAFKRNGELLEISGIGQEENIWISREDFNRIAKAFCQ